MSASKHVLVVYYSMTGNTARVARDLASRIDADIESIQDHSHGGGALGQFTGAFDAWRKAPAKIGALLRDPAEYAITVVGTPVWVGQMTPAVRAYLKQTSGRLHNVAFFVTSGDTDVGKIQPSLELAAGRKAVASAGFNATELGDAATYETKLAVFAEEIARASGLARRVA
jgi:menaquinone-dependent protoporphyrinogen IX oxidase